MRKTHNFKISIPIGLLTSIGILIYMIEKNLWYAMGDGTRILIVITLILLSLCGWTILEYERETKETD